MSELKIYQNRPHPTEPMLNVSVEWVTQITENRGGKENRIPKITEPQYTIEGSDFVLRDDDYDVFVDAFINAEGKNNAFPFKCPLDYYVTKDLEVYDDGSYQRGLLYPIDSLNYQIVKHYSVGGVNTYKTITLPVNDTIHIYEDGVEVFPTVNLSTGVVTFDSPPDGILKVECEFRLPMRFDVDNNQLNQIKRAVNSIYSANDTSIYLSVNFRLIEDMNYTRISPFNSGDWKENVDYVFDGNPLSDVAYSERSLTRIQSSDNKRELRDGLGVIRSKMAIANNNMNWNATQKYFNLFMACKGRLLPFTFEDKLVRLDSDIFNVSMIGYSNVDVKLIQNICIPSSSNYSDSFNSSFNWNLQQIDYTGSNNSGNSSVSTQYVASGGNTGGYAQLRLDYGNVPASPASGIRGYWLSPLSYTPSSEDEIITVNFSVDRIGIDKTASVQYSSAAYFYTSIDGNITIYEASGSYSGWTTITLNNQSINSFVVGTPIYFGFAHGAGSNTIDALDPLFQVIGIDNYSVTVSIGCP